MSDTQAAPYCLVVTYCIRMAKYSSTTSLSSLCNSFIYTIRRFFLLCTLANEINRELKRKIEVILFSNQEREIVEIWECGDMKVGVRVCVSVIFTKGGHEGVCVLNLHRFWVPVDWNRVSGCNIKLCKQ